MKELEWIDFDKDYVILVKGGVGSLWQDETEKRVNLQIEIHKKILNHKGFSIDTAYNIVRIYKEMVSPPWFNRKNRWKNKVIKTKSKMVEDARAYIKLIIENQEMTEGLYDSLNSY